MLVEVVENDGGVNVLLQLDHDAHALTVALIADIGDALDALFTHEFGDFLDQPRLVDHVRDLMHDDAAAVGRHLLDFGFRAHDNAAATGCVRVVNAAAPQNDAAGGEVRPFDELHQIGYGAVRVVDEMDNAVDHLAHVVRRDVGGHTHGDAVGAVDQQVREPRRQHGRLHEGVIEVRVEIDRLFIEVAHQFQRGLRHAGFGVTHGGRAVAVDRAEVALAVDEHGAHGEILRKAHHCVVNRRIAVRMVFTKHFAHDTGAFAEGLVGRHAQLVHRVEDAAVYRLEAVAHVRQRAVDDNRHGIGNETFFHFMFHVNRD